MGKIDIVQCSKCFCWILTYWQCDLLIHGFGTCDFDPIKVKRVSLYLLIWLEGSSSCIQKGGLMLLPQLRLEVPFGDLQQAFWSLGRQHEASLCLRRLPGYDRKSLLVASRWRPTCGFNYSWVSVSALWSRSGSSIETEIPLYMQKQKLLAFSNDSKKMSGGETKSAF